jgi:hypothetical protein
MGHDAPGLTRLRVSREGDQQCLIRDANEAIERLNVKLNTDAVRLELRCECGEYEAVRAYGSRFIVSVNHENPETAAVISQNESFAVVDVVAGDARYQALARHTRHAWVDAVTPDDVTGHEAPAPERSQT